MVTNLFLIIQADLTAAHFYDGPREKFICLHHMLLQYLQICIYIEK